MQPLTVPGNLCLAHLQWLSKPKNQKKTKKQKDKTQHSASDPLPLGCAILVLFFFGFLVFLVFWFLGFLFFLFFWFFHGFLQFGQNLENTKKIKKKTKSSDPWARSGLSTHKPKNQKPKKPRNQKNKKPKNQKTEKTKIAHPKGRGSDAECWVLSFWFFWFFLVFWFFGFLVSWFFGFLVCVWIAQTLPMGLDFFLVFFLCSGGFGQTAKNHGKTKKKVQTHVPCQASPQTLPMGLNFFFIFFVFTIVVLNVFHVKMLSSQYLSKKCASLQFAHLRPPGQTAKKSMEKPKFI